MTNYDKLNWAQFIWGAKEFHLAHVSWTWLDYTSSLPMLAVPPSWCTRANGDAQTGDGSATWRSCCAWTCTFDHQMTSAALHVDLPWIFRLLGPARAIHHHVMIEVGEEKIRKSVNERGEMDKTETHILCTIISTAHVQRQIVIIKSLGISQPPHGKHVLTLKLINIQGVVPPD